MINGDCISHPMCRYQTKYVIDVWNTCSCDSKDTRHVFLKKMMALKACGPRLCLGVVVPSHAYNSIIMGWW